MNIRTRSALVMMLALVATPLAAGSLSFSVEPQQMLPSVPPAMTVRLGGWTASTQLPEFALWVEPVGRAPFFARSNDSISPSSQALDGAVISSDANGVRIDAPMTVSMLNIPWFADPRICTPGTYVLRLVAGEQLAKIHGRPDASLEELSDVAIASPVTFTVVEPTGEDLAVWRFMQSQSKHWSVNSWLMSGPAVAEFVWKQHRDSNYAPFVAGRHLGDQVRTLKEAVDAFPDHPLLAEWHLELGQALGLRYASQAIRTKDRQKAKELFAEAREHLQKAANMKSADPRLKERAQEEIDSQTITAESYLKNEKWWRKD